MNIARKHYLETKRLVKQIPSTKIAKWLLEEGYYPEQYVVPPTFKVSKFALQDEPYFKVDATKSQQKFEPTKSELINVSFPKTQLTDRTFGIIEPKIYHDIVWYLVNEWELIFKKLFRLNNKIYSYSFPIPVNKNNVGEVGDLRAGRMIYEFLEMAENDIVAEAYNYKFLVKMDIKNFYPSVYTHSIAWAIHTKKVIRTPGNRSNFRDYIGLVLDKLFQYSNDGCTNGIAIGPAISDLISEIILSEIDTQSSNILDEQNMDFIGVRFKDDYRFLCHTRQEANKIIKVLQKELQKFNLALNEKKCQVEELPEGLFREWTAEYQTYSLKYKKKIRYKFFQNSIRGTLNVDKRYEGTGVVDRFLSDLYNKDYEVKFEFEEKDLLKAISLLLMLKERRNKSFPQILGIIEQIMINCSPNKRLLSKIRSIIEKLFYEKLSHIDDNQYDLIWLIYFIKSTDMFIISYPKKISSQLIKSLKNNRSEFFNPIAKEIKIFETIKKPGNNILILEHLALFKKTNQDN